MTSKATKVVSVRMPLDLYFEILEKTLDNKMTMSDYALRLMFRAKDTPQGVDKASTITIQENNRLKEDLEALQEKHKRSTLDLAKANSQLTEYKKNEVTKEQKSYYDRMEKERNKLAEYINEKMMRQLSIEVPYEIQSIIRD